MDEKPRGDENKTVGRGPVAAPIVNPYRNQAMTDAGGGPYHPKAPGFDGEALDALMKSRYTEGVGQGRIEGFNEAQPRIAIAFDEGANEGLANGLMQGRSEVATHFGMPLAVAVDCLEKTVKKSGSAKIKGDAQKALDLLRSSIEELRL